MKINSVLNISPFFINASIKASFSLKIFPMHGENGRKSFAKKIGFNPKNLIIPNQVHSTKVEFCTIPGKILNCDGVFTDQPKIVCSIQVADCMPVFFAHQSIPVFGIVHAGWRGLINGIFYNSAAILKKNAYDLLDFDIIIGPSIQHCCFEIGDDVVKYFDAQYIKRKNNEKFYVNLQEIALDKLIKEGFAKKNIFIIDDCTFCKSEKYHSYRRSGSKEDRMIGLIGYK